MLASRRRFGNGLSMNVNLHKAYQPKMTWIDFRRNRALAPMERSFQLEANDYRINEQLMVNRFCWVVFFLESVSVRTRPKPIRLIEPQLPPISGFFG